MSQIAPLSTLYLAKKKKEAIVAGCMPRGGLGGSEQGREEEVIVNLDAGVVIIYTHTHIYMYIYIPAGVHRCWCSSNIYVYIVIIYVYIYIYIYIYITCWCATQILV
jgi:hypothetical protein